MKPKLTVFEIADYKEYLRRAAPKGPSGRGIKSALARKMGCQPTYVSQVLNGPANISLEQAEALNSFFAHSKDEAHFFLLMVQRDRSGTRTLRAHFQEQMDQILHNRLVLTKRLGQKQSRLSEEEKSVFYSSWYYLAAQIGLTIPKWRSHHVLANQLGLSLSKMSEVIDFLCEIGLAERTGSQFIPTETQIRIGRDSGHIVKHHSNWRMKAIESLGREDINEMHYSAVVSLSKADVIKIKSALLEQLKENLQTIAASKEECLYGMNIDFFNVAKGE